MTNNKEEANKFHTVQAERDLGANWEVDLAKNLEDYLLKICSGEITGTEDDNTNVTVNFAEAALLLQGSVQVYSRKVEYLYNLVLHALEFLSRKRQQEQSETTSVQLQQSGSGAISDEENDQFWGLYDVPVEARNCLDTSTSEDVCFYHLVKPPANLVVLEADCLDTTGDGGELESYLLATNDLYQDFILLDPCDAAAVNDFLKRDEKWKGQKSSYRSSSFRKSFRSPTTRSAGTASKSCLGKNQDANLNQSPGADCNFGVNECKTGPDPPACDNFENENHGFNMDDGYSELGNLDGSDSDNNDPWKPLNPHEPGNLKVKPYKKVKAFRRNRVNSSTKISITTLFPVARMHGSVSPEFTEIWETQHNKFGRRGNLHSATLYEKLRQSLTAGGYSASDTFGPVENDNGNDGYDCGTPDIEQFDDEMPENMHMDEDLPFDLEKLVDGATNFDANEALVHGEPSSQASLEDLCRSHLDALLANIAESEEQTEFATRVSSWNQKIEHNLEEQDSRPPFDIHAYGERIITKLSVEADSENVMSFADVVKGQEKHDVARTFSALLQLVNNGDVDLDRSGVNDAFVCYTAVNPFYVRLLSHDKRQEKTQFRLPKKRVKSPVGKGYDKCYRNNCGIESSPTVSSSTQHGLTIVPLQPNSKFSSKLGKIGGVRCTPERKRRRRCRLVEPVDLHSAG